MSSSRHAFPPCFAWPLCCAGRHSRRFMGRFSELLATEFADACGGSPDRRAGSAGWQRRGDCDRPVAAFRRSDGPGRLTVRGLPPCGRTTCQPSEEVEMTAHGDSVLAQRLTAVPA